MYINFNRNDIRNLLLARIRSAGFEVPDSDVDIQPEFEDELQSLIGQNWRHICEEEPVIQIPIALVAPCDLRFMFNWTGSGGIQLSQRNYPTAARYFLRDVRVFHRNDFDIASELVRTGGYDWLDILEAGQLLAQMRYSPNCLPDQLGLGSVTTNNPGLSFESRPGGANQLHTMFFCHEVKTRAPTEWERNHHVAICRERVGLPNGRLYHGVVRQRT